MEPHQGRALWTHPWGVNCKLWIHNVTHQYRWSGNLGKLLVGIESRRFRSPACPKPPTTRLHPNGFKSLCYTVAVNRFSKPYYFSVQNLVSSLQHWPIWYMHLNNNFQFLNNIKCISTHFFAHTYFQKIQTTLLEQHYQTGSYFYFMLFLFWRSHGFYIIRLNWYFITYIHVFVSCYL